MIFKMTCGTCSMKEEIKLRGAGAGGSLLVNHPHDGVTSASWMKGRCLISSPATNSNLASIHGHAQSARRKTCQPRGLDPEKVSFRNEGETKTFPDKANLREFISTSPAS